jgi:hypothetical protein
MGDLAERGEAMDALESFRDQRSGKLDNEKMQVEIFIQTFIGQKRLAKGAEMMNRCPILKGEKTFDEVHSNSHARSQPEDESVKMPSKTFLFILGLVAILATGGVALGYIGGWIP